ncbi:MAG TPA: STAS domain-containing protein [Verrucomicrobiae bacterium]|nr:STAS domain-containing protein [Verrucomicrobiae bacterium]
MLKISEDRQDQQAILLRLEGRIIGPWVDELRDVCESFARNGVKITLDLEEVVFADDNAVALLTGLQSRGITLIRLTPFVEEQMKATVPKPIC